MSGDKQAPRAMRTGCAIVIGGAFIAYSASVFYFVVTADKRPELRTTLDIERMQLNAESSPVVSLGGPPVISVSTTGEVRAVACHSMNRCIDGYSEITTISEGYTCAKDRDDKR